MRRSTFERRDFEEGGEVEREILRGVFAGSPAAVQSFPRALRISERDSATADSASKRFFFAFRSSGVAESPARTSFSMVRRAVLAASSWESAAEWAERAASWAK